MIIKYNEDFEKLGQFNSIYNVVWTRKYYENGTFRITTTVDDYDISLKFIYNTFNDEWGIINKVEDKNTGNGEILTYTGYLLNRLLNYDILETYFISSNSYSENIALELFAKSQFTILKEATQNRGTSVSVNSIGDYLDTKIYSILQKDEMSFKLDYSLDDASLKVSIWQGLDRTYSQSVNSRIIFSTENKNLTDTDSITDNSNYRNYAIVYYDDDTLPISVVVDNRVSGEDKRAVFIETSVDDDSTSVTSELTSYGQEILANQYVSILNIEATTQDKLGSNYMIDYDLGDKVTVSINSVLYETRIISIKEVYKNNGIYLTLEFGDKIPYKEVV